MKVDVSVRVTSRRSPAPLHGKCLWPVSGGGGWLRRGSGRLPSWPRRRRRTPRRRSLPPHPRSLVLGGHRRNPRHLRHPPHRPSTTRTRRRVPKNRTPLRRDPRGMTCVFAQRSIAEHSPGGAPGFAGQRPWRDLTLSPKVQFFEPSQLRDQVIRPFRPPL